MAEPLTLVIETDAGTAIRRIPDASPLPDGETQGHAAEDAIRDAAATWGLPDFVFLPEQQRVGSGVRELGDGLLLVGDHAAVIQSKSRTDPTDNADRELSWLRKNVEKGLKQGSGTVRQLKLTSANMTNARGRTVPVDGKDYTWLTVVIVDHTDPPRGFQPPQAPTEVPAIVLLRRDWEFLFDHLRSTRFVLAYLLRAARGGDIVELGGEPRRYHEYALADVAARPDPVDPAVAPLVDAKPTTMVSTARAPLEPVGREDRAAHILYRMIMEDVANTPIPDGREADRLLMLAALDGLPVGNRSELGRTLVQFMKSAAQHQGDGTLTHSRTVIPNPGEFDPLVFIVASKLSEEANYALTFRMQVLHHDYSTAVGDWEHCTLGVMLTPTSVPGRLWNTSTTALWGDQGQPPEVIEELRTIIADSAI
ncbi:hypothetical protein SAMN04489727_8678 [Amycolatopsis tolypomycina]|uniref:Uncharacterized protein n=1 Tax=Amycolatopsis tolypomycina TaxID=208445 RepID=A0A1H5C9V1_9PSEU|nr:hypothetical protein [Amycolatopsis tolypomycina]SED63583.1 hypothetical protein SAMN04489727_8678 [Amycolatopsis tolypomycina]